MSLSINFTYSPLADNTLLTTDVLNELVAGFTVELEGSIGSTSIADNSITLPKLQVAIFTADAAGRAPFVPGWLNLDLVGSGIFTANVAGRAPFAPGIWSATYLDDSARKGLHQYAAGTLSAGVYTVTLSPVPTAYTAGMKIIFKADTANAGAVDVNVNTIGAKNIFKNVNQELEPGDIAANQIVELVYDGTNFQYQLKNAAAIVAAGRNILAVRASAATVTVTADEFMLKDTNGAAYVASTVNVTANIASSGANGLDTGSEASSTWYYLWVIYNGTTVASLLSTSATAPTMPSGYTFKGLVGPVRNDGSSNFIVYRQHDRKVFIQNSDGVAMNNGNGSTSYTTLSLSSIVPPMARDVGGSVGASQNIDVNISVAANSSGLGAVTYNLRSIDATTLDGFTVSADFDCPLETAQTLSYKTDATGANYRLTVTRYTI